MVQDEKEAAEAAEFKSGRKRKMHIGILEKKDNYMRFIIKGIDPALANTIRRIILSEVPTMAIDEIIMIENSSILHDEILALRLGLIPLKSDLDSYNLPEECSCQSEFGCNLCRATLTLDVQADEDVKTVYSGDLIPDDPGICPVSEQIPIVKLAPGQRVRLEAYARLGKGKDHAKWQPVSLCIYRYMPRIQIDYERCSSCRKCVEICPKKILIMENNRVKVKNVLECNLCRDCMDICEEKPPAINVSWDENAFIFEIESTGSLPVDRIIIEAFKVFEKKFSEFMKKLDGVTYELKEN